MKISKNEHTQKTKPISFSKSLPMPFSNGLLMIKWLLTLKMSFLFSQIPVLHMQKINP